MAKKSKSNADTCRECGCTTFPFKPTGGGDVAKASEDDSALCVPCDERLYDAQEREYREAAEDGWRSYMSR